MRSKRMAVKITANFEANLASIGAFCLKDGAPRAYASLLEELLDAVIPNLEQLTIPNDGSAFPAQ